MAKRIAWIYAIASAINVASSVVGSEELNRFTKPLLMPLLLFYVYQRSIGNTTLKVLFLSAAILFSWFGDLALMYQKDQLYFILGIGLFLIAQGTYVVTLRKTTFQKPVLKLEWYPVVAVGYGGTLLYLLLPAGALTVPIIIYGMVIITMTITAYLRKESTTIDSYRFSLIGSILFVLSDSILAINSFKLPIPYSGAFVMSTYCAAQYLLVEGLLRHPD